MERLTLLARIGQSLRTARRGRGLTQAALGARASLPRLKVIQIERGDAGVSMGAYADAAAALGMELSLTPARRPTLDEVADLLRDE